MKKKHFFLPLLAALILSGCSNDEPVVSPDNGGTEGEPQYLTVNLITASASGTLKSRAGEGQQHGEPNADEDDAAIYEEGLANENTVNNIRFYFFDKSGAAADVKKVGEKWQNWLDWTNISEEGPQMPNVEKILSAMLVINTKQGDEQPDKIVAIINPKEETGSKYSLGGDASYDLYTVTDDYRKFDSGNFVMSNSTYKENDAKVMAVSVKDKIFSTSGEALQSPVDIYVERTVAKVRLKSSLTETSTGSGIYKTFTDDKPQKITVVTGEGENPTTIEKNIYVKFLGWNTTAVTDKSRLIKEINPNWTNESLGFPWNWSEYCRSFWAVNPTGLNYQYGAFRDDDRKGENLFHAQAKTKFDKTEWVYVNENASNDSETGADPKTPTKVIIAAQLVDESGNFLEFAEYGSQRCSVDDLKKLFANSCGLYKKTSSDPETYKKIESSDLKIVTATELGMASKTQDGRYKVYIQLADAVANDATWYPNNTSGQTVTLTAVKANEALKDLGSAKVWKDGYTYYYFDINHLGNKLGVVRNHIYDANITTLVGLGTPVYNPDEIIYPEKPDSDKDTYIAARINILSWRVVNSSVKLEW